MRRLLLIAVAAAAGCTTYVMGPPITGDSHQPYLGKPSYLTAQRESWTDFQLTHPNPVSNVPPVGVSPDRVRSLLAAIDSQVVALSEHPTDEAQHALALTVNEVEQLFPRESEIGVELDELARLVARLATTRGPAVIALRTRMGELTDLVRLQLLASH